MDKKLLKTLKKLYHYSNGVYDRERQVTLYQVDTLTAAEQEFLQVHNWNVNDIVQIEHDVIIDKLVALQQNESLSWRTITDAFIAGVGGSYPRGISALASYHMMIHTTPHTYKEAEKFLMCKVCGFSHSDQGWENISWIRYAIHLGNYYGGTSRGAYVDLYEIIHLLENTPITPTADDINIFNQLLVSLDEATDDESPGKYEKRLTSNKLIKGTPGIRRGILQSLAMVGVIPNQKLSLSPNHWTNVEDLHLTGLELNNTSGRSDMEMPWAGWRGELGVDWNHAKQLFGYAIQDKS
ncbi:hypothetical protein [Paenibacillus tundrae]